MTIEYKTQILSLRARDENGLPDVVRLVDFRVVGKDGDIEYSISAQSRVAAPDPAAFTPLSEVTESQVIDWLETSDPTTMEAMRNNVRYFIDRKKAEDALAYKPLPWAPTPPMPPQPVMPE